MTKLFEPLTDIILQKISAAGGMISFAEFMELALYHPLGYYQREDFTLGREGDFTTAPEISPLFAQCFAAQQQEIAQQINANTILEIGAGTGKFAGELLKQLAAMDSVPDTYYIYDISPVLRSKQRNYLLSHYPQHANRVVWLEQLPANFKGTIIGNEVLDALPVHCFEIQNEAIYERCIANDKNGFCWQPRAASGKLQRAIQQLLAEHPLASGYQSEINLQLEKFLQDLAQCLTQGVILLADYGYGRSEYYHPARRQGTLTCFYQHRHHDNPLLLPGQQDITAHVDFTAVAEAASQAQLEILGYTTQAAFLLSNGLLSFAAAQENTLDEREQFALHQAIKTLLLPSEMGELIKIIGLAKDCDPTLTGFARVNRVRDL